MGYYTSYYLHIEGEDKDLEDLKSFVEENKNEKNLHTLDTLIHYSYDSAKWCDYKEDIEKISKLFPNIEFYLEGIGEEEGDRWEIIAEKGKVDFYYHRIISDYSLQPDNIIAWFKKNNINVDYKIAKNFEQFILENSKH